LLRRPKTMTLRSLVRPLHLSTLLFVAACGGSTPAPADPSGGAAASATTAPEAGGSAAIPGLPARDPKLAEMIKAALACAKNDEFHSFDRECAGFKAWDEADELFAGGKADDTLLSMWGDPDPNVRHLALPKRIKPAYWQDKGHAQALFAIARAEKIRDYLSQLGTFAGQVDGEKVGLAAEQKDLAKHPSADFRARFAAALIPAAQTPLALEIEQILIDDGEKDVRVYAVLGLAGEGVPASDPVCKLLTKQLARADDLHANGIQAAAVSKCPGMRDQAAAEIDKRTADPTKVTFGAGMAYASALFSLCYRAESPEAKKKIFTLTRKLVDPKSLDRSIREKALDELLSCDRPAGEKLLGTFAKDKDLAQHVKYLQDAINERKAADAKNKKK